MLRHSACLAAVALVAGCSTSHGVTASADSIRRCTASVASFANPDAGAKGDFRPNVLFSDVRPGDKAIGYGAAGGRSDEITLADGVLHLARPDGSGGHRERRVAAANEGAYMLQMVDVVAWTPKLVLPEIVSLDALGASIAEQVRALGCGGSAKLAYRIEGRIRRAEWSLDTLPERGDFVAQGQRVVVVGLYANADQARHFVPEGRNIHAHAVFPDLNVAGHLKMLELEPGAKLQLQSR